jgi:hypothetical protein
LDPLFLGATDQPELDMRDGLKGREVEVVAELQADVLAMLLVLWVAEVMGSQELAVHERLGYSAVAHDL